MKNKKEASVVLYVLVLVFFAMTLVYIVASSMSEYSNKIALSDINEQEKAILSQNAMLNLEYDKKLNSDGGGFLDAKSCPTLITTNDKGVTIGTNKLILSKGEGELVGSGKYYCAFGTSLFLNFSKWNDSSISKEEKEKMKDFFIPDGNVFDKVYSIEGGSLKSFIINGNSFLNPLRPTEKFSLVFSGLNDNLDDNINSDDYNVYSKKENGYFYYYPNKIYDNDADARTHILGIITEETDKENIFLSNEISEKMIENNKNNEEPIKEGEAGILGYINAKKIMQVDSGKMSIKFHKDIKATDVEYEIFERSKDGGDWQAKSAFSDLENFDFDFNKNYYKIFLKKKNKDLKLKGLSYELSVANKTFAGDLVYINPIDDSKDGIIEIYQAHVFNHGGKDIEKGEIFSIPKPQQ
ncbi:hypothetical protein BKN14_05310 [Candidatus Gracilibacteria bacterium HOT-871]|nr:hypothetical protein BKN14_05310 [Candidatus Gracilibacteria bacterium HOT-871]MBB1564999.1 hypothetical protein [Candidatus Gracilibacteria bacterium]RKW20570.1 MAG: hypothetical protein D8B46_09410 [Candidatus Gracilibacteria bacterium]